MAFAWHLVSESRMHEELAEVGLRPHTLDPAQVGMYLITREDR